MMNRIRKKLLLLILAGMLILPAGCSIPDTASGDSGTAARTETSDNSSSGTGETITGSEAEKEADLVRDTDIVSPSDVPEYSGDPYVTVNGNEPEFRTDRLDNEESSFESYSSQDSLGRCQTAVANIGEDLMPDEDRGSISQVKPTGWHTVKYDNVDGKYLYNRCHLIGYQLTAENANEDNLITGTRYLNVEGMLPFENMVADYIKETGNHVLYQVTPVFEGDNLVASGVQMEAYSVEDDGDGICFNVYAYNVQPGIQIDYATGDSREASDSSSAGQSGKDQNASSKQEIRGNSRSRIYHCPGQNDYENMKNSKYLVIFDSEKEAQDAGYRKAKR